MLKICLMPPKVNFFILHQTQRFCVKNEERVGHTILIHVILYFR